MRIAPASRALKRRLGPMAWAVLEDVALDASLDDAGRLVATTSTRRVAENLATTPGTAARALSRLRALGLVTFTRQSGAAGRFGLSAYLLGPLPGVEVGPVLAEPAPSKDRVGRPDVVRPGAVSPCAATPCPGAPRVEDAHMVAATKGSRRRRAAASAQPADGQLDLLSAVPIADALLGGHQPDPIEDTPR